MSYAGRFFGEALGSEAAGVPADKFEYEKSVGDALDDNGEIMHRQMLKLATLAYELTDKRDSLGYHMYSRMQKEATWRPGMSELMRPIYDACAVVAPMRVKNANIDKQALGGGEAYIGGELAGKILGGGSSAWGTLLTAALATGSGLGALHWGVNRHVEEDDKDTEAMKAQLNFYDQMTDEINYGLKRKGITPDSEQVSEKPTE